MMSLSCERRSSKRLLRMLRMQRRRAMMALAPATVQRMPGTLEPVAELLASGLDDARRGP